MPPLRAGPAPPLPHRRVPRSAPLFPPGRAGASSCRPDPVLEGAERALGGWIGPAGAGPLVPVATARPRPSRPADLGWYRLPFEDANASSTSCAPRMGAAPRGGRCWCPTEAELWTDPGTAPTSAPRRRAASTVCHDPRWRGTRPTTTMRAKPAMSRFRDGNRHACAGHPGGVSDTTAPSATTSRHSAPCRRG